MSEDEFQIVKGTNVDDTIKVFAVSDTPRPQGAGPCSSHIDIVRIEK